MAQYDLGINENLRMNEISKTKNRWDHLPDLTSDKHKNWINKTDTNPNMFIKFKWYIPFIDDFLQKWFKYIQIVQNHYWLYICLLDTYVQDTPKRMETLSHFYKLIIFALWNHQSVNKKGIKYL